MNFTFSRLRCIPTVGICAIFFGALIYIFYQLLHLYRNRKIRVECWFCQALTTVKAPNYNAFFCSSCNQYNGFTESGDYNRLLPAQYEASLNPCRYVAPRSAANNPSQSDILCVLCTQRQAYKIEQLARFEASKEANWDRELQKFRTKLEDLFPLCPSCTIKVSRKIDQIDTKFLPSLLSWWRNRNLKGSALDPPSEENPQDSLFKKFFYIIPLVFRLVTTITWLFLMVPVVLQFFQINFCQPYANSSPRTTFKKFIIYLAHNMCDYLIYWMSILAIQPKYILWGEFLCLFGHLSLLLLQLLHLTVDPLFILLDAILCIAATHLVIKDQRSGWISSVFFLSATTLTAGIGVLARRLFTPAKTRHVEKGKSDAWSFLSATPSVSPPSYYSTPTIFSKSKSGFSEARSLTLDGLSLYSTPHSPIFSPPILLSPTNTDIYGSSIASGYTYLRRWSKDNDVNDLRSHLSSINQCPMDSKGQPRRSRKKRRAEQPAGLLRWLLYLLFGRLETWKDVKRHLVSILYGVLVGVLLVLVCHLFCKLVPFLWRVDW